MSDAEAKDAQPFETRVIPLAKIRRPAWARKINKKNVAELADSIKAFGLLQPPGVTPDPDGGDSYNLVFGGHRIAAFGLLGEDQIAVRVLDFDAGTAEVASQSENLHRTELSREERYAATEAFVVWYRAKHPEINGRGGKRTAKAPAAEHRSTVDLCPDAAPPEPETRPKNVAKALAERQGTSKSTALREIQVVEKLDADQRAALVARDVTSKQIAAIAAIREPDSRNQCVNLIASGMPASTAIAVATAPPGATVEDVANVAAPGFKSEADMTDDEWFSHYCGDTASRLKYVAAYRSEALLYRNTLAARDEFKGKIKKPLAAIKGLPRGPLGFLLTKLFDLCHPKDWPVCAPCAGSGQAASGKCPKCLGNAFHVKTETA